MEEVNMKKIVMSLAVVLVASWIVFPSVGMSKPEFAKKEGNVPCTTCHVKPAKGDENLNPVGKCYKDKQDFAACKDKK